MALVTCRTAKESNLCCPGGPSFSHLDRTVVPYPLALLDFSQSREFIQHDQGQFSQAFSHFDSHFHLHLYIPPVPETHCFLLSLR